MRSAAEGLHFAVRPGSPLFCNWEDEAEMCSRLAKLIVLSLAWLGAMPPIGAAEEAQMVCKGQGCRIENIAADYSSIAVVDSATAASIHFVVKDTNLQERLKGFQTGD